MSPHAFERTSPRAFVSQIERSPVSVLDWVSGSGRERLLRFKIGRSFALLHSQVALVLGCYRLEVAPFRYEMWWLPLILRGLPIANTGIVGKHMDAEVGIRNAVYERS